MAALNMGPKLETSGVGRHGFPYFFPRLGEIMLTSVFKVFKLTTIPVLSTIEDPHHISQLKGKEDPRGFKPHSHPFRFGVDAGKCVTPRIT